MWLQRYVGALLSLRDTWPARYFVYLRFDHFSFDLCLRRADSTKLISDRDNIVFPLLRRSNDIAML
jgi:hypothetical protein